MLSKGKICPTDLEPTGGARNRREKHTPPIIFDFMFECSPSKTQNTP